MAMEIQDIFDRNKVKIGKVVERGTTLDKNEYVLATEIVIFDGENYLISQRHPQKNAV
ncbi:hypothetical protein J9303_07865 [Bacillaceae bacterium Marseille-Q3522]|nr:hypothetical protein [Bacillaceae bacterium Marseille-Q3522]